MLILTRRVGETLMIGDEVTVTVLGVKGNQVRIGVNAPRDVPVHREENDLKRIPAPLAFAGDLDAAHHRHVHIEQQHIHFQSTGLIERVAAIVGLVSEIETGIGHEHSTEPVAVNRVVVREDDFNFAGHGLEFGGSGCRT